MLVLRLGTGHPLEEVSVLERTRRPKRVETFSRLLSLQSFCWIVTPSESQSFSGLVGWAGLHTASAAGANSRTREDQIRNQISIFETLPHHLRFVQTFRF